MFGLAKKASFDKRFIGPALHLAVLTIPTGLLAAKEIQQSIVDSESKKKEIRKPLNMLNSRKEKTQAVRTAFQDQFSHLNIPDIDNNKTEITVGRSMFPWKDNYDAHIFLYDKNGEAVSDWDSYDAKVYRDKSKDYTGYVDMVFTRDNMQGKGIGRTVENKMVDAFRELGASKSKLMPAFDGPYVWAKKRFGYKISPEDKAKFLKMYEKWSKKNKVPFKDLGDDLSKYPDEFLKDGVVQYPWRTIHYEKGLDKAADEVITGLVKLARRSPEFETLQRSYTRDGLHYGVSISKDKDGYFAHTHRARSKSYPTVEAIPVSKLKFVDSTG